MKYPRRCAALLLPALALCAMPSSTRSVDVELARPSVVVMIDRHAFKPPIAAPELRFAEEWTEETGTTGVEAGLVRTQQLNESYFDSRSDQPGKSRARTAFANA